MYVLDINVTRNGNNLKLKVKSELSLIKYGLNADKPYIAIPIYTVLPYCVIVQGRLREDKKTFAFFLDIQKAYDTVWHDGLWYKLWDMGVKGRMWRVIKKMYMSSRNAVLLEGEKSDSFNVEVNVAQGCSLSPILFSVFINDLLKRSRTGRAWNTVK